MAHQEHQNLINKLSSCLAACEHCADACLSEDNIDAMVECIRIDRDCAEVCALAIKFVSRDSDYASAILDRCADLCSACAEECGKHDHDHCQECAKACRECADACRNY
ncbi:four-helix bundle copper-binding protein [Aliifodinibius sp. 1BSP15-2V2]|uniref:Four-helix bundle copper-binding protein n=2 Tax=Fodinibius salsisoli TaxID=2820877 RepID=A0ABT3PJX3_9BACT|nr:four-helix bundle copper-binding protein [Fodinibius salsisoli]